MPDNPPQSYEEIVAAIHDRYEKLSRGYQKIARYVTQNPNDVAMQSISALAERGGVHPSSLVRFAQLFGYKGFKELQIVFQSRLATAAQGFEARVSALKTELQMHRKDGYASLLGNLVARDIASLQDLLRETPEEDLDRAVDILAGADTIYIVGQLRSAPIAVFMRYVLSMLRRRAVLLDADGGLSTEMARVMRPSDCLIAVSFRFYAKEVVNIAEAANAAGIPIVAISDSTLSPLAKCATVQFSIPEDEYTFSRSLAAPMCLAQALLIALADRLDPEAGEALRIPTVTQLNRSASNSG
ncbi:MULTISPECIES: MurR/RpiR family transcriptional regulator [Phyllobacteriaceae]|uniref:MurR/RpiR family transcriptional regulator n=1 Tax=Phyllobacteriaceae TaxID=69277 RepID=UPI002ACAD11F|nr:MurR/RpiR family transcriptional regulator [Chelativorans sp. M5D2P16]MDZ5695849.1 MurR/RpiR family transcriptional regulator [Chelativorans sp. M5D2P16]